MSPLLADMKKMMTLNFIQELSSKIKMITQIVQVRAAPSLPLLIEIVRNSKTLTEIAISLNSSTKNQNQQKELIMGSSKIMVTRQLTTLIIKQIIPRLSHKKYCRIKILSNSQMMLHQVLNKKLKSQSLNIQKLGKQSIKNMFGNLLPCNLLLSRIHSQI